MKTIQEYLKEYKKCKTDAERWKFVIKHKENIIVWLDNDLTWFYITDSEGEVVEDDDNDFRFSDYIGNGGGLHDLFEAIGVKSTDC